MAIVALTGTSKTKKTPDVNRTFGQYELAFHVAQEVGSINIIT
jgi:hypothetical protein